MKFYQQGDIVLIPTKAVPKEAKDLGTVVVQEGETSGHAHRFLDGGVKVLGIGEAKFLSVTAPQSTLTHEEHLPQTIEKGDYEVRIVRQKDPFTKLISRVID